MNLGRFRLPAIFVVVNVIGLALLITAFLQGWVTLVLVRDISRLSIVIGLAFLIGLVNASWQTIRLNRRFDQLESNTGEIAEQYCSGTCKHVENTIESLKIRLGRELQGLRFLLVVLPALGLLGTVFGITLGLEGSLIGQAGGEIAEVVDQFFFQVLAGLSVAFYTTIVGMVFMLWTYVNVHILEVESMKLLEAVVDKVIDTSGPDGSLPSSLSLRLEEGV